MSAFIRVRRAARIMMGLLPISILHVALANGAMAGFIAAKTAIVGGAPVVSKIPPAVEPFARYFSINRVLAEHDRQAASSAPSPLATVERNADGVERSLPSVENDEPFGLATFRAPEGVLWTKWRGVEAAIGEEAITLAQCRKDAGSCDSSAALRFLAMVEEAQKASGRQRIDAVNRMVNSAVLYASDMVQHGVADLWSAPLATLSSGRGDCEDYAIAKYVLLRESGLAAEDLRLLLVRDNSIGQDHAVVAVRDAHRWLILDNRWSVSADSSEMRQLTPLFAMDEQGVRLFAAPYQTRVGREDELDSAPATSERDGSGPADAPSM